MSPLLDFGPVLPWLYKMVQLLFAGVSSHINISQWPQGCRALSWLLETSLPELPHFQNFVQIPHVYRPMIEKGRHCNYMEGISHERDSIPLLKSFSVAGLETVKTFSLFSFWNPHFTVRTHHTILLKELVRRHSKLVFSPSFQPVSYTHLTLPTKRIV